MQQYYPVYNRYIVKNKYAKASFALSIVSIVFLILIIPLFIVGGLLVSMAGQDPESSGVDFDDPRAMEGYNRDSIILGIMGILISDSPVIISGITGMLGLYFGITGVMKKNNRGQAVAGIVMSCITTCICIGIAVFIHMPFSLLLFIMR